MTTAPNDPAAHVARAMSAQPRTNLPPRNKRIHRSTELKNGQGGPPGRFRWIIFCNQRIPRIQGWPIGRSYPARHEFFQLGPFLRSGPTSMDQPTVACTGSFQKPGWHTAARPMRPPHSPRPRMSNEASHQDQPLAGESLCRTQKRLLRQQFPSHLRGKRLAQYPTTSYPALHQCTRDGARVVGQAPTRLARVSRFDQSRAACQFLAKWPQQGPVAVETRQV